MNDSARSIHSRGRHRFRAVLASIAALILAVSVAPVAAQAADLGTNVSPNTANYNLFGANTFFAYVEEGDYIYTWATQAPAPDIALTER